ncbi:MAG: cupin domain-containing protein [Gammaproteobacteria bacterium]|nr:cupin domain-containing protein [Gammaproteobacteria bacterium]
MIHNLNIKDFLQNYWQKKPLLIRSAFPDYESPISAEELAGLACEDFIESRIILEQKNMPKWALENGPFPESRFTSLPNSHWTLLIQGLNKVFPEFDDLLHEFNFIPSWRVDDLMASYAAPDGSVGPHIDQYDVFLLQAKGRRKWMINETPVREDNFEENIPLKLIKEFKAETEWVLEAGDMLYLPANIAHYGIGMEDCMTFSIGFRAPSHAELLSSYVDEYLTDLNDNLRYQDPDLLPEQNNGEITSDVINKVQKLLISQFNDKSKIEDWFGRFITEYLNDDEDMVENTLSTSEFLSALKETGLLRRPSSVRANYLVNQNNKNSLYINGVKQVLKPDTDDIAKLFCNQHVNTYADLKPCLANENALGFLRAMYNKGYLEFPDE